MKRSKWVASAFTALAGCIVAPSAQAMTVDEAIRRVETAHPLVQERQALEADQSVALRRARWNRIRGMLGARGGYGAGATGLSTAPSVGPASNASDHGAATAYADLRFPIYAGGALSSAIDSASAELEARHGDKRAAAEEQKRLALIAYAGAVAAHRGTAVAEWARERAARIVTLAETRRDSGVGTDVAVARAELLFLRRREELAARMGDERAANAVLRTALALDDAAPLSATDSLDRIATHRGRGQAGVPEVRAARARVHSADADVTRAWSGYLPTVELAGAASYGTGFLTFSPGRLGYMPAAPAQRTFEPAFGQAFGGIVFDYPAFDLFVTRDRIARAEKTASASRARVVEANRQAAGLRRDAHARLRSAEQRIVVLERAAKVSEDAVRLARGRYEAGGGIFTDVLEAELERVSIQARRVTAEFDRAVAHIDALRGEGVTL